VVNHQQNLTLFLEATLEWTAWRWQKMAEQSFQNHTRRVPAFHFFVLPVFLINFGWSIYRWKVSEFSLDGLEAVVMALAVLVFALTARMKGSLGSSYPPASLRW
jgi:Family of unknown function (DUF6526)